MDIQFVTDAYACVMYIASYMIKNEKGMSELLKQVGKESRTEDITKQLRRLGSAFLYNREVSAQEVAYRLLCIPTKQLSRSVVFFNTNTPDQRIGLLKPFHCLEAMDDSNEDIFQKSLLDRYVHRPQELEEMSYAEFGANYAVLYSNENRDDKEKNPQDFFRMKLMLYLPWRNETSDLLGGYQDYYSHHANREDILVRNENKYTADVDDLMEYLQQLNESGPPQHIWSTIAPTSEQNRLQEEEGYEQLTNLEEEDLQALSTQRPGSIVAQLHARYKAEAYKQQLPAEQYRGMMRVLNEKQLKIVKFDRR